MKRFTTIRQYIQSLADEQREVIEKLDTEIKRVAPNLKRKLWEQKLWGGTDVHIIGYGGYHHTYVTGSQGALAFDRSYSL